MAAAARKMGIAHRPVNLSAGVRVVAGVYHVQNVNAYDSRLKDWLRRFKGVATQYRIAISAGIEPVSWRYCLAITVGAGR